MPPGEHEIEASRAGKPAKLTMRLKPEHAVVVNTRLQQMLAAFNAGNGDRPYFDLNHDDKEASAHRAKVSWTGAGERAVRGKDFSRFSPSFYPDKAGNVVDVPMNMGGLVNRAAFQKIQSVVRSKSASAEEDSAEQNQNKKKATNMETLMAVLAKLGLLTSANLDEATAVTQVTAKFSEITQAGSKSAADLVTAKADLEKAQTDLVKAKKATAKTVVEAAIAAGRIPGQNDAVKAKWEGLIEADPANAELLPEVNPALKQVVDSTTAKDAKGKTELSGGAEHAFLAKAKQYATDHKTSEAFAVDALAHKEPALYDEYRASLGLGGNK